MYELKIREFYPCFADIGKKCKVLKSHIKKDCLTCNFYKPKRDYELDQERALKRIDSLDVATRNYIYQKYFK